jgi:catechol 2,3-dioxygenase-like lactoylglutathione lyase family enzyme
MFGFTLAHRTTYDLPGAGFTKMAWIKNKDYYIEIYQYPQPLKPVSMDNYLGTYGTKHVCFYVAHNEFKALRNHLIENKAKVVVDCRWPNAQTAEVIRPLPPEADPETSGGVMYVMDPDGILVEVQEEYYPGVGAKL